MTAEGIEDPDEGWGVWGDVRTSNGFSLEVQTGL